MTQRSRRKLPRRESTRWQYPVLPYSLSAGVACCWDMLGFDLKPSKTGCGNWNWRLEDASEPRTRNEKGPAANSELFGFCFATKSKPELMRSSLKRGNLLAQENTHKRASVRLHRYKKPWTEANRRRNSQNPLSGACRRPVRGARYRSHRRGKHHQHYGRRNR